MSNKAPNTAPKPAAVIQGKPGSGHWSEGRAQTSAKSRPGSAMTRYPAKKSGLPRLPWARLRKPMSTAPRSHGSSPHNWNKA